MQNLIQMKTLFESNVVSFKAAFAEKSVFENGSIRHYALSKHCLLTKSQMLPSLKTSLSENNASKDAKFDSKSVSMETLFE